MVKKSTTPTGAKKTSSVLNLITKKYSDSVQIGAFINIGAVDVLSTGSLSTDIALGTGGIPRGCIVEFSGEEGSAKTTTCLRIAADAQRRGYTVAFIDTEYALDPRWVDKMGVKIHKDDPSKGMIIFNVDTLEKAGEISVLLAESGEFNLIILDSIAGAPIEAQLEGDIGDANMGKRAKALSTMMPKLNGPVRRNGVWFVLTNQLRYSMAMYGDKWVAPGGKAVPHHCTQRIQLRAKKEKADQGSDPEFVTVIPNVIKNKISPPYKKGEYDMYFEDGKVDLFGEVAAILTNAKHLVTLGITRAGAYYTFPEEMVAKGYESRLQGASKVAEMLASDIDHFNDNVVPYVRRKLIIEDDIGFREHRGTKINLSDEEIEEGDDGYEEE